MEKRGKISNFVNYQVYKSDSVLRIDPDRSIFWTILKSVLE